jgi:hypothetical protein
MIIPMSFCTTALSRERRGILKEFPRLMLCLGNDRGTNQNRWASNHRSPLAHIPLERLFSGRGGLLIYQEQTATSSQSDDPFTSAREHPMLVSLPHRSHTRSVSLWKIPPSEWATVLQRIEHGEPFHRFAPDYGVSYEAIRGVACHSSPRGWDV